VAERRCVKTDGSAKESAACKCGSGSAAVDVNEFCFVTADLKGVVLTDAQCAKVDGSAVSATKCSCGAIKTFVANCGMCFVGGDGVYTSAAIKDCASTDGSKAHLLGPDACKCNAKAACGTGKFCYAAGTNGFCRDKALVACTNVNGKAKATDDCLCGTAKANKGQFCFKDKTRQTVNTAAVAACTGTDGDTVVAASTACQCEASMDVCVAGEFCDKALKSTSGAKKNGKCQTTKKTGGGGGGGAPAPAPKVYSIKGDAKVALPTGTTVASFKPEPAAGSFQQLLNYGYAASLKGYDTAKKSLKDGWKVASTAKARRAKVTVSFDVTVPEAAKAAAETEAKKIDGDVLTASIKTVKDADATFKDLAVITIAKADAAAPVVSVKPAVGAASTTTISIVTVLCLAVATLRK